MQRDLCFGHYGTVIRRLFYGGVLCALYYGPAAMAGEGDVPDSQAARFVAPAWALEFKGGIYQPDLEDYKTFYGSDDNGFMALGASYRFTNWLDVGAELGYSKDSGAGLLPGSGTVGGSVDFTLVPIQLLANFRYDRSLNQVVVPYAGVGLAGAWYDLDIEAQSGRDGLSDLGWSARAGLQLLLNRLDSRGADYVSSGRRLRSYLFLEAQVLDIEKEEFELGGKYYSLGFRFEFDG